MHSAATMPGEEATLNRSYFTNLESSTYVEIIKDRVIITKDKLGTRVSIGFGIHYGLATKTLQ